MHRARARACSSLDCRAYDPPLAWTGFGALDDAMLKLPGEAWSARAGMNEARIACLNAIARAGVLSLLSRLERARRG
jgi:hypothetical protein